VNAPTRYAELRARLAEITDLERASSLLAWDQQTMMPPSASAVRGAQRATLAKIAHERFVADETGRLLDDLAAWAEGLPYDSDEASLVRETRREWEKERRVPASLREEMTHASSEAFAVWVEARRSSDFARFVPALQRNVDLRRRYIDCFDVEEPYDAVLDDFEPGMKTREVRDVLGRLERGLSPLVAEAREREVDTSFLRGDFPVDEQRRLDALIVSRFGLREGAWRIDPTEHPFATPLATTDIRLTTRHFADRLDGVFATMHECGHGLYEHNVDPALERTPLARGASAAIHESQSRLFENLVGRGRAFWRWLYPEMRRSFPELARVDVDAFHRAINAVTPSLVRVEADQVTYGLHIVLRFELEQEMLSGRLPLRELSDAWDARMKECLGVDVPDAARGVLQDVHWALGLFGYFPTYALGNVISVQLWEKARAAVPDLDAQIERGEFDALCTFLRESVWRHGRKFPPRELLRRTIGGPDPDPYLRHLAALVS
jgi:carboxypeptidase Taq